MSDYQVHKFWALIKDNNITPDRSILDATLASVEEGLLSAKEGFEALQQLNRSKTCTPISIVPTYEQYLTKIRDQISNGTMVLGVLEGQILDVCFTYDKQQYEVLRDLFTSN